MFSDFIQNNKIFHSSEMSKPCRESMIRTLQGLGLPTPMYSNREPWGYKREGTVFMPIEQDLQILLKAVEMDSTKQYNISDIVAWIQAAPISRSFEKRNFFNIKRDRPPFPELRLPVQERIELVHRTATTPAQEGQ